MRRTLPLLLLLSLFGCTKEKDQSSIVGKWMDMELIDDVGGQKVSDPLQTFIEFRQDGTFSIDNSTVYTYYKPALGFYSRYLVNGNTIKFYNNTATDTLTVTYSFLSKELLLSYGRCAERFTHHF